MMTAGEAADYRLRIQDGKASQRAAGSVPSLPSLLSGLAASPEYSC